MYKVEVYARVRRAVQVDGMSIRQAAREFGLARKTIRKMLQFALPPGYERKNPIVRPKLGPWVGVIDQILVDDRSQPKKQRHTAKRIWDRLKAEHGFTGGYTVVKDYVRLARLRQKEVFVPLTHPPGEAQADFGEALVVIGGVEQKGHFLCIDLPHSDDSFVMMFPAENTEAFLEGHNQAFAYFQGVPQTILYDNTAIAVKEITGDGERKPTEAFSGLQSHYLFEAKFGRPGKGNDKGNVEGLVGYARRNFMVPVPRAASWEELNAQLLEQCRRRRTQKLWGHQETIAERFERDRERLLPLPPAPYEACDQRTARASSQALVRYETNDYSVPVEYGHRQVLVKAFVWELVIGCGTEVIARHARSYGREEMIFNPLHYLALLEQKSNALDQAAPLQGWHLPEEFSELRRQMETRLGKRGRREYVQVLRLMETFSVAEVGAAARQALQMRAIGFDAVKHLLLCALEQRPPKLDLENYPHLPAAEVALTRAADYQVLLMQGVQ
ncbi:MAG TPA: IS21 family transposase [Candidatus Methylomirabilis sp.]|nr:IS21 family transposase [Candidatus Methylomirabilis sp.]